MESASVCIVGPCKNVAEYLPTVLPKLMTIASWWKTWKVVLYENDSTDGTPDLLHAWKDATEGDIEILHDTNLNARYPDPIVRLAYIRNRLLDSVPPSFDYMLMVDLDDVFLEPPSKEAFASCFELKTWDVMTANGRRFYYDIWALRIPGRIEYNCWQRYHQLNLLHRVPKQQAAYQAIERHKEFMASLTQVIPVDSAYNIGILCKVSAIRPCCRFGSGTDGKPVCEHVPFQACLRSHGARILFNPRFYL